MKHEEVFSIPIESTYKDIVNTIYEEIGTEDDYDRVIGDYTNIVSISLLDPGGYIYIPIHNEYGIDSITNKLIDNTKSIPLKNEALVTCSRFADKFSSRKPIQLLLQQINQDYAFIGVCVAGGVIDYDTRYTELYQDFYTHHGSMFKDQYILATKPFYYFGYRSMSASSNNINNYSERMKKCKNLPSNLNVNDGNAYYRSIYFGLFEQIIAGKNIHLFGLIANIFREVGHDTHVTQHHKQHSNTNTNTASNGDDGEGEVEVEVDIGDDGDFQELITTLELASSK